MSEKSFRLRGSSKKTKENLIDSVQNAKVAFWAYLKENDYHYDSKAESLESKIKLAEYELYCCEHEDNRKRNWK